jgi:hypothetical protein
MGVRKNFRPFAPGIVVWNIAESRPLSISGAIDPKKIPSRMITNHNQWMNPAMGDRMTRPVRRLSSTWIELFTDKY